MTDRELLELAAKAAGISLDGFEWRETAFCRGYYDECESWNPLTDDGDSLRLAVRLDLTIKIMGDHVKVGWPGVDQWIGEEAPVGHEMYPATRRAIVRAAAALAHGEQKAC